MFAGETSAYHCLSRDFVARFIKVGVSMREIHRAVCV